MGITQNANILRVDSAAKNGTLAAQVGVAADEILLDTTLALVNNGDLEASPSLFHRHLVIRPGLSNEEENVIRGVDVAGVKCTLADPWNVPPALGDAYLVSYNVRDLATFAGCAFSSATGTYEMKRRLIIGTAMNPGFFAIGWGTVLVIEDRGPMETGLEINAAGRFCIGTIKNDKPAAGAVLIFRHDGNSETVMHFSSGSIGRLYDFTLTNAQFESGVTNLTVTVDAGADVQWAHGNTYGMNTPFKRRRERIKTFGGVMYNTVGEMKAAPWYTGWLQSETDQAIKDQIAAEPDDTQVRLLIEFK